MLFLQTCGPMYEHDHNYILRHTTCQSGQESIEVAHQPPFDINSLADSSPLAPGVIVLPDGLNAGFDFVGWLERPGSAECDHAAAKARNCLTKVELAQPAWDLVHGHDHEPQGC